MSKGVLSLVVIEPSAVVVRGLCALFDDYAQVSVVGVYNDLNHFLNQPTSRQQADAVLINPSLFEASKSGAIKKLFPQMHLVALHYAYTHHDLLAQFDQVIELYDTEAQIVGKLQSLIAQSPAAADQDELSMREKEILVAVAKGLTNKEIAEAHHISAHTVISHRKNISRKTGIKSVSGFVVYALLNNLIQENEIQ